LRQAMGAMFVFYQRLLAGFWLASDAPAGLEDRPPRSRPSDRSAPSCQSSSPDYLANKTNP
jgi:hypothetical protein